MTLNQQTGSRAYLFSIVLVAIIGVPALIGVLCFAPDWATAVLVAALCVIGCH